MNEEYLLNTIDAVISTKKTGYAHINDIRDIVLEDMKLALNQLVSDKKLLFHRDVNGNPIFKKNGGVD